MSAANRVTAEEVERVLAEHEWNGMFTCRCGKSFKYAQDRSWEQVHRAHVAAHILKLLESKGEGE